MHRVEGISGDLVHKPYRHSRRIRERALCNIAAIVTCRRELLLSSLVSLPRILFTDLVLVVVLVTFILSVL